MIRPLHHNIKFKQRHAEPTKQAVLFMRVARRRPVPLKELTPYQFEKQQRNWGERRHQGKPYAHTGVVVVMATPPKNKVGNKARHAEPPKQAAGSFCGDRLL